MRKQKLPNKSKKISAKPSVKKDKSPKAKQKKKYKIRNWHEYNESLKNRGKVSVWIDPDAPKGWIVGIIDAPKPKRGSSNYYSDLAIETVRTMGIVYHQALRQTEGFCRDLLVGQMGFNLDIPDYTTLSRRGGRLKITLPKKDKSVVAIIVDSSGVKVFGEGEWKVRQHGYSKRRDWLKFHLSSDRDGEIRAVKVTDSGIDDASVGCEIIRKQQQETEIDGIYGDGGYDKAKVYAACTGLDTNQIHIPPREDAKIWVHGNRKGDRHPRDEALRGIRKLGRRQWKETSGYHQRSIIENVMYRYKTIHGDRLQARKRENQELEVNLKCKILNLMAYQGMPDSYAISS